MDELKFEPYAVKLCLTRPKNSPKAEFSTAVACLAETVAGRCLSEKEALIGHIKGFASGSDGSYLHVSVTDAARPADIEGHIAGRPKSIILILNVHVFGVSAARLKELLIESLSNPDVEKNATISIVEPIMSHRIFKEKNHAE